MPVALSAAGPVPDDDDARALSALSASRAERSRPRVFFVAVLALAPLGVARRAFSSSARRASFSAFLRAASAFLASASSLWKMVCEYADWKGWRG